MYLNAVIFLFQDNYNAMVQKATGRNDTDFFIPIEKFGLIPSNINFSKSPICSSLLAGMVSVTYAQYKLYDTRHSGDLEIMGKIAYLFACFLNTCTIFLSYVTYYSTGFATFIMILLIVIRDVCGMQDYEVLPESNEYMIWLLIILFVIAPLILLPRWVGYYIKHLTNKFIMRTHLHQRLGIQSGYEVPGIKHGTYMFLPQSFSDYKDPNSSLAIVDQNGFNSQDSSRNFYRLRFKMHIWHKIVMHFFYLTFSGVCLHSLDILVAHSGLIKVAYPLWVLEVPLIRTLGMVMLSLEYQN